jgi:hypothetical protein
MAIKAYLGELVQSKDVVTRDEKTVISGFYCPTVEHSVQFVDMTGDMNPIHREIVQGEVIAPGFMHTTAALLLIEQALREQGRSLHDFPFATDTAKFGKIPVVTGNRYAITASVNDDNKAPLTAKATITDARNNCAYSLERVAQDAHEGQFFAAPQGTLVHSGSFRPKYGPLDFGRLIGSESSERMLYGLAAASSICFDAIAKGKLTLDPATIAFYTKQQIRADMRKIPDLSEGIHLELYTDKTQFGRKNGSGQTVDMQIAALDQKGNILYVLSAPVSFKDKSIVDGMMRLALRRKD